MCLLLKGSGLTLPESVQSHETPDAKRPMFLSQSWQAKLGLRKNMRKGTHILEAYGEELEVARQACAGLCMIRIAHLLADDYTGGDPRLGSF